MHEGREPGGLDAHFIGAHLEVGRPEEPLIVGRYHAGLVRVDLP